jgi:translocation and assembly module TamB
MSRTDLPPPQMSPAETPGTVAPEASARRRRFRPLGFLVGAVVSLVLVLVLTLGLVLGTQTGLRFAVGLAEDVAPGVLGIERIDGRVLGALHLGEIKLDLGDFAMQAGSIDLDWAPFAALGGTLPITTLRVRDLDLVLPPSSDEPKPPPVLPEVVLPLAVDLGEARVDRVRLFNSGDEAPFLEIDHAAVSASLCDGTLTVTRLATALAAPKLAAHAAGRIELKDAYPLTLDLDWELTEAPAIALQGSAEITGDLDSLRVRHRLIGSARAELDVNVDRVLTNPSWDGRLDILGVNAPDFGTDFPDVLFTGNLATQGDLDKAEVTGRVDARAPDLPDFGNPAAVLDITWSEQVLTIRSLELTEQSSNAFLAATGQLDLSADSGRFDLDGRWEGLRWPLNGDPIAESPRGTVKASGSFDAFDYALSLAAQAPDLPPAMLDLDGTGSRTGTRILALKLAVLDGELLGQGDVGWSPALDWTLGLNGENLNPGLLVDGLEDRLSLQLNTSGGVDAFVYDLDARTVGPGLPESRLQLDGRGDRRRAQIETLLLDTLGGRIVGEAEVGWDPKVSWEASLQASDIDPSVYAAEWPGTLGGRLSSRGTLEPSGPELVARIERVEGILRGYIVEAVGTVTMSGETIRIEDLNAASGPTSLSVEGRIDNRVDLDFALESSDLTSLMPETRGAVSARGKVSGPRDTPRILLDVSARNAEWQGQGIAGLSGTVDLGIAPEDPFEIRLDGTGLVVGDLTWSTLSIRGQGRIPDHRFELSAEGTPVSIGFGASGGLDRAGAYTGRIARLDVATETFGDWALQRPSPVSIAGQRIAAGPVCIRGSEGTGGCIELTRGADDRTAASLDFEIADFALIAQLLPSNLGLTGNGRIRGRFETTGATLSGSATAEIPQGALKVLTAGKPGEVLEFSGTRLGIDADARALSARLGIPLKGFGQVDGVLDLPGWRLDAPTRSAQPLAGSLRADLRGLDRLSDLVPDINGITGGLDVDVGLSGTLGSPGLTGEARIQDGGFTVPLIGLVVSSLNLTASAPAIDRLDLQGGADVGGGRLDVAGDARFGGGFAGQARISGNRLTVANTKEYFALVSPQIAVEANSDGARISGELLVPEARIRPRFIPAGVETPSSDVVRMDQEASAPFPLEIDVRLKLGDAVTVDAFGLRGRLGGEIALLQSPGRELLGDGQLQIVDGQYRLTGGLGLAAEIGAPLTIQQGRMIFARSAIDNPGLVIQAEREGGATVAGVQVLGTLRDPKLAFFSETDPGMTQAEITKFLLTGIAPSSNDQVDGAGLAVGTYIAPKLFLEYGSGLGDQSNSVRLRYDLTDRIELQTETGDSQGADIFYSFER